MELPNESASFVIIFVLFCFHLGLICGVCFRQKGWKSFYSYEKNILFSYDIIRGIQQAKSISFFPSVGNQSWNRKKTHFALFGNRSEHSFPVRSQVWPEKLGKRVNKVKILTPEPRWLRFRDHVWKRNLVNDTINYSGFVKRFRTSIHLLAKLDTVIVDGE